MCRIINDFHETVVRQSVETGLVDVLLGDVLLAFCQNDKVIVSL